MTKNDPMTELLLPIARIITFAITFRDKEITKDLLIFHVACAAACDVRVLREVSEGWDQDQGRPLYKGKEKVPD